MGLLSGLARAGVAKRIIDEARKPQNQQKAKGFYQKVRGKDDGSGSSGPAGRTGADTTRRTDPPQR